MKTRRKNKVPLRLSVGIFLIFSIFLCLKNTKKVEAALADHLVINEIHIDGIVGSGGTEDDWVELYNPTENNVSLEGWSIQKTSASGLSLVGEVLHGIVPAKEHFLIVRNGSGTSQSLKEMANLLTNDAFSLANNNIVALVDDLNNIEDFNDSNIVDFVGFGSASYYEGSASAPNPKETKSIVRNPEGEDNNQNSLDFILENNPSPQNSLNNENNNLEGTVLLTINSSSEAVQNISPTSAQIVFSINSSGKVRIDYGEDDNYGNSTSLESVLANTEKRINLDNLNCGTSYHYSIYAENEDNTENDSSDDNIFTTLDCGIEINSLSMEKSLAKANNNYSDGWVWDFNITVWDLSETSLKMKFDAWSGLSALNAGGNMQFSVNEIDWIDILNNDTYPNLGANISLIDNDSNSPGRQVEIKVRMKLPFRTLAGEYNSNYGILTE